MNPNFLNPALVDVLKGVSGRMGGMDPVPSGVSNALQPGSIENALAAISSAFGGDTVTRPNGLAQPGTFADSGFQQPQAQPTGQDLINQAYATPDAAQRKPAFRTADLAVLLPALFAGDQAGSILSGYAQGKAQKAQQDTQSDQAAVDRKRQGLLSQGQAMLGQEAQRSQQAFQANQAQLGRESDERISTAKLKADALNRADRLAQDIKENQARVATAAFGKFQQAKTLPEMKAAAARYNANVLPDEAITDDQITEAYGQKQRQWIDDASRQVQADISSSLNNFGEVDPANAKLINARREALAKSYGIDPKLLPSIPTGQTIRAQHLEEYKRQFAQSFGQKQDQWAKNLQIKLANLDLAKQRLQWMEAHGADTLGVSRGQLDVARQNLAIRKYESSLKDAKNDQFAGLRKIDQQLKGLREARKNLLTDKAKESNQQAIDKLQGQRQFLVDLLPESVQQQDAANQTVSTLTGVTPPPIYATTKGPQIKPSGTPYGRIGGYGFRVIKP